MKDTDNPLSDGCLPDFCLPRAYEAEVDPVQHEAANTIKQQDRGAVIPEARTEDFGEEGISIVYKVEEVVTEHSATIDCG